MADRPQNRKKNGKRRPVYDQARDTRPSRPADRSNVGYPSSTTPIIHENNMEDIAGVVFYTLGVVGWFYSKDFRFY